MNEQVRPSLRDRHKAQTRTEILRAFAACLAEKGEGEISVPEIAALAGVSDKTVYRHFPTRVDLMAEFGVWYEAETMPLLPLASIDELPEVFARAMATLDEHPRLAKAMALSSIGREALSGLYEGILQELDVAIVAAAPHLSAAEKRRYMAALHYLDNIYAWVTLRDHFDMDAAEMADVIGWVMRLVIRELHAPPPPK